MRPEDALRYIAGAGRFGELGLGRIGALLEALSEPQRGMRFYHVAGTNGKGSAVAAIDRCLRSLGRRTGRYISPHLERPSERVTVDGREISPTELAQATQEVAEAAVALADPPTEFELWTAVALLHMRREGVTDVAWETGLGGRLDATNVVRPEVSLITSIGLDHVDRLGGTFAAIAFEKAGIIKPGRPVMAGRLPAEAQNVVRQRAGEQGSPLWEIGREIELGEVRVSREGTSFAYRDPLGEIPRVAFGLIGAHQAENGALALAALRAAGTADDLAAVLAGLRQTRWPARFEIVPGSPEIVLDGAHNPQGFEALARTWRAVYPGARAVIVFGCLKDRDAATMTEPMQGIAAAWHTASPGSERALSAEDAARAVGGVAHASAAGALQAARAQAQALGLPVVVCGSLYLVGAVRGLLRLRAD